MEQVGRFDAHDEAGATYVVVHWRDVVDTTDMKRTGQLGGLERLMTDDGRNLIRTEKGVYEIVETSVRIASTDPDAP